MGIIILSLLAGLFAANGIPHFIKGIIGQTHQTPFGKNSSAVVNVLWGWSNFVIAALLAHWANLKIHPLRGFGAFTVAVLVMALILAQSFSTSSSSSEHNHSKTNK